MLMSSSHVGRRIVALSVLLLLTPLAGCENSDEPGSPFLVGTAKRGITPTDGNAPPDGQVYLGGYGAGPVRKSTGILAPIFVRAFVVSNGTDVVAFAENETQGSFASYKSGPF